MLKNPSPVLAAAIPLAALALTMGVVYPTWKHLNATRGTIARQRADLATLRSAPEPQREQGVPAADDTPDEPARFMGDLRLLAAASGCEIVGINTTAAGVIDKPEEVVHPRRVTVEVKGTYQNLRSLLARLTQAPRTSVVTDLKVDSPPANATGAAGPAAAAADRRLTAMMTIERFVTPPAAAGPTSRDFTDGAISPQRAAQRAPDAEGMPRRLSSARNG